MATVVHSESKRMYSWWWDSHINPKNSKWLLENLADMDTKVKSMIKLIEEDGDTFAKRAEMYYKKRPELLLLVEGFYRTYRALAERYDHARVGLRHAHKTIAEVYPGQVPSLGDDDSSYLDDADSLFNTANSSKETNEISSLNSSSVRWSGEKGLKHFSEMFKFEEALQSLNLEQSADAVKPGSQCGDETRIELEVLRLSVVEMQAEKDAVLLQYHQSLEKLSNMQSQLNLTEDNVRTFEEQRREVENEIGLLREALMLSETEKDSCLLQCQELLDLKTKLEAELAKALEDSKELGERSSRAENEVQNLRAEVLRLESEREAGILLYEQCMGNISRLRDELVSAEENVRVLNEKNSTAEAELRRLKEAVNKLNGEREAAAHQFIKYSETISKLKSELSSAHKNIERLNSELLGGASKLKDAEEQCTLLYKSNQTLRSDIEDMVKVIVSKDHDIADKQNELEKLQICIQEEQVQLLKVEASLSTWQNMHSQSHEDHKVLALELRNGLQMLQDLEISKHNLQEELHRAKSENRYLNDMNVSSTLQIKNLTSEATSLRDVKEKLENKLGRQVDLGNSLQQDICNLKDELGNLNRKYQSLLAQIESVGLQPDSLESSVKELLGECSKLKEVCVQKQNENAELLGKLDSMSMVLQRNVALESSLLDVTAELVGSKQKLKALEESSELFQNEKLSLVAEKTSLVSQLQLITEKIQELLKKNTSLEDTLSITNVELQGLRDESKNFEEVHQLLKNEKSILQNEKDSLVAQLADVEKKLEISEYKFSEVEEKYAALEKDTLSTLHRIEELHASLGLEKQERTCFEESNEARLAFLETRINLLTDEERSRKEGFEKHEKAMRAEVEILLFQKLVKDLEEKNVSLIAECRQHADKTMVTNKLISQLDKENMTQQAETAFLLDELEKLRSGIFCVFQNLENGIMDSVDEQAEEQNYLPIIAQRVEMMKEDASKNADEKQQLHVQNSVLITLIEQLNLELAKFQSKSVIGQYLPLHQSSSKNKNQNLLEFSDEDNPLADFLNAESEDIYAELLDLRDKYMQLQDDHTRTQEENENLIHECSELKRQKEHLENENNSIVHESVLYGNLSSIFEGYGNEKDVQVKQLTESLDYLSDVNTDLERELETTVQKLENKERENLNLKESIQTARNELFEVKNLNDQLYVEVLSGRKSLAKKELELSKAKQRLKVSDDFNKEINATVEALRMECQNSKRICEDLGKQVLELSSDKTDLKREVKYLCEERMKLDSELCELHEDLEMHRTREEDMSGKLRVSSNKSELWKAEAEKYYSDLQVSAVYEIMYQSKLEELVSVCVDQEKETATIDAQAKMLKNQVCSLETEIQKLKSQLFAYPPVIDSLKEDITSLESIAHFRTKLLGRSDLQDSKDVAALGDSHDLGISGKVSDLEEMRRRIEMLEKAVLEDDEGQTKLKSLKLYPRRITEGAGNSNSTRSIKEKFIQDDGSENGLESWTSFSIVSQDDNSLLSKDIPLDEVLDTSYSGNTQKKNGMATDQMLELWEVAEQSYGRNSRVKGKHKKAYDTIYHQSKYVERMPQSTSIEFLLDKELSVDKQEVVNVIDSSQEDIKNKILEKLASDAKKLANTQAMVQDLRIKLDTISKSNRTKEFEFETMREHLQEVEKTSVQLMETNIRLKKNIEKGSSSSGKSCADWEDIGSSRRKRVHEQARKASEKVGRLHLEAQKIQGVVKNMENEKKKTSTREVYRFSQARTNILLGTFIHRGSRNGRRQRNPCFGCMQPVSD